VNYEFSFQAGKNPDLKECGTIVTVVHNQKDLNWSQKMSETVPDWI